MMEKGPMMMRYVGKGINVDDDMVGKGSMTMMI